MNGVLGEGNLAWRELCVDDGTGIGRQWRWVEPGMGRRVWMIPREFLAVFRHVRRRLGNGLMIERDVDTVQTMKSKVLYTSHDDDQCHAKPSTVYADRRAVCTSRRSSSHAIASACRDLHAPRARPISAVH